MEDYTYTAVNSVCHGTAGKLKNFRSKLAAASFLTARNSFIHVILNEILDKTIPAGIPQYLIEYHSSLIYKKYEPIDDNEPRVLTVNDLSFGFVLWLGSCAVAVVGFIFELFKFCIFKAFENTVGLYVFLKVWNGKLNVFGL
jgi:hypothetical protein